MVSSRKVRIIQSSLTRASCIFQKAPRRIRKLRRKAEKERNTFDYLFMEHFDHFYRSGLKNLTILFASKYNKIVEQTLRTGTDLPTMIIHTEHFKSGGGLASTNEILITAAWSLKYTTL